MKDPDYGQNDPKGWCGDPKRGAALGRPTISGEPDGVITLRQVILDEGGYDFNGTYFGHGQYLFWYADADHNLDAMLRASDYDEALGIVSEEFPGVEIIKADDLQPCCAGPEDEHCPKPATEDWEYCEDHCHLGYEDNDIRKRDDLPPHEVDD